jgi:hypothetical protein
MSNGKASGKRLLLVKNGIPKLEIYIVGTRIFAGSLEVKATCTYGGIQRPDMTFIAMVKG